VICIYAENMRADISDFSASRNYVKRAETKYLSECFSRHLHHLSTNRDPLDGKSGSSDDAKSYGKPSDTKISELCMSENGGGDKVAKSHALLGQRLGL